MNVSEIKKVAEMGSLADPDSSDINESTLAKLRSAFVDSKPDSIFERRFSKGEKKGVTIESLSACAEALIAKREAKNNRVRVEFDNFAELEKAKETQEIGKFWNEGMKIVAYSYGDK